MRGKICTACSECRQSLPIIRSVTKLIVVSNPKKSFVLRIDTEVYKALEKWAADEFRSVNGQIEWILSQKLKEAKRIKDNEKPKGKP